METKIKSETRYEIEDSASRGAISTRRLARRLRRSRRFRAAA